MAGNKIHTKTKGKEDKNKSNKSIVQGNEENEDVDFSILRKPILTSITGFAQARKIFDLATEELKGLLSNECDLLYECKVCRNIFRSLANFISHKRIYCKEKFNSTQHGHFKTNSAVNEMLTIKKLEETYLETLLNKNGTENVEVDENDCRIPLTKDLTTIIEKIVKNKGVNENKYDNQSVTLQKIPNTSVAVFQNVNNSEEKQDKMKIQVRELDVILSKDKAVLQSDGNFKIQTSLPSDTDSVIQISDDDDEVSDDLKCKICDQNFSTQKTLKFHMKYKHVDSRLVYPCPDCLEIFSTSWSVYRHLFKVHRKTAAQIRRLRESIQAKAFKMNNPPAFYEKRKNMKPVTQKISEEERLDQENQAWMDNVEGDGSLPRCFGCGRTFERRAALAAHAHTCQPRSRALAPRRPDAKRIEIQIRKDYHKGPAAPAPPATPAAPAAPASPALPVDAHDDKTSNDEISIAPKPLKDNVEKETEKQTDTVNQDSQIIETLEDDEKSNDTITESPEISIDSMLQQEKSQITLKLPFAHQAEKSNLTAFRQRIQPDIEVNTLLCKKCDIQHNSVQELYDHMAGHYKWMRYACKLCNFKTYYFSKLPEHLKVVHKLKGDIDFYFSTVKAIDGNEATELSENVDELPKSNDASPDSRRQSRCSSDSSRLSDDSSSSSTRIELGSRKRKIFSNKGSGKRKRESIVNDEDDDLNSLDKDNNSITMEDSSSMSKTFEENSSDMDDIDEKISKRHTGITPSVASRRPVRKKTKRKNEDFEYDLSNLLKMEAQGYRDSQASTTNTKSTQNKKKTPQQESLNYYEIINKDCCGALATLSKKAVECSAAHIKNTSFIYVAQKDPRPSSIFVRPMIPKIVSRTEKSSPKKDPPEDTKDAPSPQKEMIENKGGTEEVAKDTESGVPRVTQNSIEDSNKDQIVSNSNSNDVIKPNIPAVVPIKFRRQSLDLIKNPIINKNITDFKKAGMKTKILVIKPINRNKDGTPVPNNPLKFQTIKLKDPSKCSSSSEEKSSDQVVVVKVPKVETISRNVTDTNAKSNEKVKSHSTSSNPLNNNVTNAVDEHDNIDDSREPTESCPINIDELSKESISNEKRIQSDACHPVSDAKELITDKETIQNVPDTT